MTTDEQKKAAADAALELVGDGMTLGLGTGSTAAHFIRELGRRVRDGLSVVGVPTSEATRRLAEAEGVEIIEPDETTTIDLAVDGADELDARLTLIKGGGGALLREKIVARAARRFVVIADASKKVAELGAFPLPVEVEPALYGLTLRALRETLAAAGYPQADIRIRPARVHDGAFLSDNGRYVVDCALGRIADATALDEALRAIPGVADTGLFIGLAHEAFLGGPDGVRRLEAPTAQRPTGGDEA